MKRRLVAQLLMAIMLLLLSACNEETHIVSPGAPSTSPGYGVTPVQATPTPEQGTPMLQQPLPKGLLNPAYPVMDWVFNVTCNQAIDSYGNSRLNATIAYDSAAWLYPSDGHLVVGGQNCHQAALVQRARSEGLPVLITVGVDSSWPEQSLAQYIDRAASQQQVPCTAQATTYICAIVNWAIAGGYTGVIIDFELVKVDYPDIRMKFAAFMQKLQDALHQKGLLCGIALIHKVSDLPQEDPSFSGNSFEDWKLLGELDFLVVMVVDLDLSLGKPGPLVSIPWLDQQLDYLWQTMPQALSKTIFEFPLYGREWQQNAQGQWQRVGDETCQQVGVQQATHTLLSDGSTDPTTPEIAWMDGNGSRHEVWYDTAASLVAVMTRLQDRARALLNDPRYKLPTSFWYRGAECAGFFGPGGALEKFYNS